MKIRELHRDSPSMVASPNLAIPATPATLVILAVLFPLMVIRLETTHNLRSIATHPRLIPGISKL